MAEIGTSISPLETYHIAEWKKSGGVDYLGPLLKPLNIRPKAFVLDLGCGSGYVNAYLSRDSRVRINVGLELAPDTLELARKLAIDCAVNRIHWICGGAEDLPFSSGAVDHLICRAVLPYTILPRAISEISRVMAHGGSVLLLLHPWTLYARKISLRPSKWKTSLALLMILAFGVIFHFTGLLFRPRFGHWRISETFQTLSRTTKLLRQGGFSIYKVQLRPEFLVYAAKIAHHPECEAPPTP